MPLDRRDDDLQHHDLGGSGERDGDDRAEHAADRGAREKREEHEHRRQIGLAAHDVRRDDVPFKLHERHVEHECDHGFLWRLQQSDADGDDAGEDRADVRDQFADHRDHTEHQRELDAGQQPTPAMTPMITASMATPRT